jgi:hypothetical protein
LRKRIMPDIRAMEKRVFMVEVTVPARMTAAEVIAELGTCISFGRPVIMKVAADQVASPTKM